MEELCCGRIVCGRIVRGRIVYGRIVRGRIVALPKIYIEIFEITVNFNFFVKVRNQAIIIQKEVRSRVY